jgi:hypothetical protein
MNTAKRLDSTMKLDDASRRESTARLRSRSVNEMTNTESSRPSAQVRVSERVDFYDDVPCTD